MNGNGPAFEVFSRNAVFLAGLGTSLWFALWGLRRKFELDIPLNSRGRLIRSVVVLGCWLVASLPLVHAGLFRIILVAAVLVGLAFLIWPNVVVRISRGLGQEVTAESAQNEVA